MDGGAATWRGAPRGAGLEGNGAGFGRAAGRAAPERAPWMVRKDGADLGPLGASWLVVGWLLVEMAVGESRALTRRFAPPSPASQERVARAPRGFRPLVPLPLDTVPTRTSPHEKGEGKGFFTKQRASGKQPAAGGRGIAAGPAMGGRRRRQGRMPCRPSAIPGRRLPPRLHPKPRLETQTPRVPASGERKAPRSRGFSCGRDGGAITSPPPAPSPGTCSNSPIRCRTRRPA